MSLETALPVVCLYSLKQIRGISSLCKQPYVSPLEAISCMEVVTTFVFCLYRWQILWGWTHLKAHFKMFVIMCKCFVFSFFFTNQENWVAGLLASFIWITKEKKSYFSLNVLEYHRSEPSLYVENKCYCDVALKVCLHRQFHTDIECENSWLVRGSSESLMKQRLPFLNPKENISHYVKCGKKDGVNCINLYWKEGQNSSCFWVVTFPYPSPNTLPYLSFTYIFMSNELFSRTLLSGPNNVPYSHPAWDLS